MRRPLVHLLPEHTRAVARKGAGPIDRELADALGGADPEVLRAAVNALELLAERLTRAAPGSIIGKLWEVLPGYVRSYSV